MVFSHPGHSGVGLRTRPQPNHGLPEAAPQRLHGVQKARHTQVVGQAESL